jgi:integrase
VKTRRPEARQTNGPYTVAAALTSYFAYLRHEGRPEDAVSEAEGRANALIVPKLGKREVATLTAEQFRAWRDVLVKSGARLRTRRGELQKYREIDGDDEDAMRARRSSANRVWTILRAALNHAFAEGKAPSDKAWRQVKPFRGVDSARPHWLTVQQAKRAINAADPDFRKLVQAALLTGGRYGSLARLKARDFHERAGVVSLRTRKGDGTEKRFDVALTDEGLRFFRQACAGRQADDLLFTKADGTPWQKSDQARPMAALSEHAKIKPAVSFNVLRHTWASLAVMNGAPLLVVAKNLGHTDTRMVEKHYGHLAPSYVADAVRAHAPKFGLKPDNVRPLKVR